jgi:Ca2+/Na+ antiporter
MTDLHTSFPSVFDSVFLVAMILFWIATIVASFMIDSHPIFFVATLLLLIFTIFFSAIVSNTFSEVTADESINADEFPITRFIMEYLPYFLLFIGFSVAIVLYGKYKREGLHLGM